MQEKLENMFISQNEGAYTVIFSQSQKAKSFYHPIFVKAIIMFKFCLDARCHTSVLTLVIHILYVCYTAFPFLYPTYRYILRPPVLVNSSTVFLQFQANRQNVDRFEAAYAFHDGTSSLFSDPSSSSRDHPYIMSAHFWTFKTHPLCQHKKCRPF